MFVLNVRSESVPWMCAVKRRLSIFPDRVHDNGGGTKQFIGRKQKTGG